MKLTERFEQYVKNATTQEGIQVAIGLVLVEGLTEISKKLDDIGRAWGAVPAVARVDVVGHTQFSPQVPVTSPIKADKTKPRSKKIQN